MKDFGRKKITKNIHRNKRPYINIENSTNYQNFVDSVQFTLFLLFDFFLFYLLIG